MFSKHPLKQMLLIENGIEKAVHSFQTNPDRKRKAAAFNKSHHETFQFIMDARVDHSDMVLQRHMEVVFGYLYVRYVNELCGIAESKNGFLLDSFAHYHDVCDAFNVLLRSDRQQIIAELFEITNAVVALDIPNAQELAWNHIKNVGKCLRDRNDRASRSLPGPSTMIADTVSLPVVETLIERRIQNITENCDRFVAQLHKSPESLRTMLHRLRQLIRIQLMALQGMEYEKGELFESLRRTWLAADTEFHDTMYEFQEKLLSCGPGQTGWNPKIVWYLGSQSRPGHVRESIVELQHIYKALESLDAGTLKIHSATHVHENLRRYSIMMRSGGGFTA